MFIRRTKTGTSVDGNDYYTFRLVVSQRVGDKVRQRTLLNLGRYFSLPREQWGPLCTRIDDIISGQLSMEAPPEEIETLAQRYAARLIANQSEQNDNENATDYQEVDVASLELVRPRSIGVEHVGLEAIKSLNIPKILEEAGLNKVQRDVAIGAIIGRMAEPGSERATWQWLTERSGLGELMDVDFESMSVMRLYRTSDLLVQHRHEIEDALFSHITDLFSLTTTVTLYDLTNTFFEGNMTGNDKAQRGHSKEKRSDCPLVTLGLILDDSGFIRGSQMFAGNVSESKTLQIMLEQLKAPKGALVIMDRGIATQANIDWLIEHHYRYLVVSRERTRSFDPDQAVEITTASDHSIKIHKVINEEKTEARLYCHSDQRQAKEKAITKRFIDRFEAGLHKIADSLTKPRGTKKRDKVLERIGRLKEKSKGIGQHYKIDISLDESGNTVTGITWEQKPVEGTQLTDPGIYCLRTNELQWDEAALWKTYTMLTDLEAVFRSLKSELGLRPIYHHKKERTDGHLFITVLAYQAVQVIRRKLKDNGINDSWSSLRKILSGQQRVTATFKQKDGHTLHIRKTTVAEPKLKKIYDALKTLLSPGRTKKTIN
ncbi:MAG: IS1634 family transposase [Deltaproteobacteria bacterium]|nr:IS1634 family transposase [Candidatus Tharpellaceae bacterium]